MKVIYWNVFGTLMRNEKSEIGKSMGSARIIYFSVDVASVGMMAGRKDVRFLKIIVDSGKDSQVEK